MRLRNIKTALSKCTALKDNHSKNLIPALYIWRFPSLKSRFP